MECNKEEALRAKEIAEKKLSLQDYSGALKLLQKAIQIYPGLENTAQMSAVLDVHIAAQTKINGCETDWYGILQVGDTRAEEIMIKKQYKKLALLLHPDKNKLPGAEAAFKLIGEALQILSDKQQRAIHDSRRKQMVSKSTVNRSQNRGQTTNKTKNPSAASVSASLTFMTICPACHTRYQYYRVYENQNLLCHQCRTPFVAREFYSGPNINNAFPWQQQFTQQQQQQQQQQQRFNGSTPSVSSTTVDYVTQMMKERQYMDANISVKRKREDEEREMRRIEKERQKKAKADQKAQEALERMMRKKREQEEKAAAAKDKKKRKRKRVSGSSSEEDDVTEESLDGLSDEEVINHVVDSGAAPRRSARPRRNVTYKIDVSDDDEDPSSNAKEEIKQNEGEKKDEDDAQTGDSVDMQEKQKLADFFKVRIRLSLNLQNANNANAAANISANVNGRAASSCVDTKVSKSADGVKESGKVSSEDYSALSGKDKDSVTVKNAWNEKSKSLLEDHSAFQEKDNDMLRGKNVLKEKSISPSDNYSVFEEKDKDLIRPENVLKAKSKSLSEEHSAFEEKDLENVKLKSKSPSKDCSAFEENDDSGRGKLKSKFPPTDYSAFEEKDKDLGTEKSGMRLKPFDGKERTSMNLKSKSPSKNYFSFEEKDSGCGKNPVKRRSKSSSKGSSAFEAEDSGGGSLKSKSPSNDHFPIEERDYRMEKNTMKLKSKSPLKDCSSFEQTDSGMKKSTVTLNSKSSPEEKDYGKGKKVVKEQSKFLSNDHSPYEEEEYRKGKNSTKDNFKSHSEDYSVLEKDPERRKKNQSKPKFQEKSIKVEILDVESDEPEEKESEQEIDQESETEYEMEESKKTFHDFKKEREEKDVMSGQVWAAYDDIESLPRYYFKVKEIHCRDPFKANITWLELRNMSVEQRALKERGYHPVCGANFRGSSSQVVNSVDIFSHVINWEKGPKGTIKIYPTKGEVWAIYRGRKSGILSKRKSSSFTYDIVEIVGNYDEQTGVTIAYLVKLFHYKSVFKSSKVISSIPAEEFYSFSYQVPAHRLKGNEAPGIEEGFWELDPASLPR